MQMLCVLWRIFFFIDWKVINEKEYSSYNRKPIARSMSYCWFAYYRFNLRFQSSFVSFVVSDRKWWRHTCAFEHAPTSRHSSSCVFIHSICWTIISNNTNIVSSCSVEWRSGGLCEQIRFLSNIRSASDKINGKGRHGSLNIHNFEYGKKILCILHHLLSIILYTEACMYLVRDIIVCVRRSTFFLSELAICSRGLACTQC